MLTTVQAAIYLQVAPRTVCKWCDNNRLKHEREENTNNRLIKPSDLVFFMKEAGVPVPDSLLELCK